jgi:hypothetical protein
MPSTSLHGARLTLRQGANRAIASHRRRSPMGATIDIVCDREWSMLLRHRSGAANLFRWCSG